MGLKELWDYQLEGYSIHHLKELKELTELE